MYLYILLCPLSSSLLLFSLLLSPHILFLPFFPPPTFPQLSQVQSLATLQAKLTAMASQIQQQQLQQQQKGGASPLVGGAPPTLATQHSLGGTPQGK